MLKRKQAHSEGHHPKSSNKCPLILQRKGMNNFQYNEAGKIIGNSSSVPVQAKLRIGQSGDRFEKEADQVAKTVVSRSEAPQVNAAPALKVQTMKVGSGDLAQKMPESETETDIQMKQKGTEEHEEHVQMKGESSGNRRNLDISNQLASASGGGKSMDRKTKSEMEGGFGRDFSGVRVHTDGASEGMNESLNAKAFTSGQDIFFNKDQYRPDTKEGKHLLAHELTHTVQQDGKIRRKPKDEPPIVDPYQSNIPFTTSAMGNQGTELTGIDTPWYWTSFDKLHDRDLLDSHRSEIASRTKQILTNIIRKSEPSHAAHSFTSEELLDWRVNVMNDFNKVAGLKENEVFDFRSQHTRSRQMANLEKGTARLTYMEGKKEIKAESKRAIAELKVAFETEVEEYIDRIMNDENVSDESKNSTIKSGVKGIREAQKNKLSEAKDSLKSGNAGAIEQLKLEKSAQIGAAKKKLKHLKKAPKDKSRVGVTDRTLYDQEMDDRKLVKESGLLFKALHIGLASKNVVFNDNIPVVDPKQFSLGSGATYALEPITDINDILPLVTPRAKDSIVEKGDGPYAKFQAKEKEIDDKVNELKKANKYIKASEKSLEKNGGKLDDQQKADAQSHIDGKKEKIPGIEEEIKKLKENYGKMLKALKKKKDPDGKYKEAEDKWKTDQASKEKKELEEHYKTLYGLKPDEFEAHKSFLNTLVQHSIDKINRQRWQAIVLQGEPGDTVIEKAGMAKSGVEMTILKDDQLYVTSVIQEGEYGTVKEKRFENFHLDEAYEPKPKGDVLEKFNWLINYRATVKE